MRRFSFMLREGITVGKCFNGNHYKIYCQEYLGEEAPHPSDSVLHLSFYRSAILIIGYLPEYCAGPPQTNPVEISLDDYDQFLKPNYNIDVQIAI